MCLTWVTFVPQPAKSVRFLTDEDSPPLRPRTSSWSAGTQIPSKCSHRPAPLEVWAPSLTLGRDGPGIILKEGKVSVQRKGLETVTSDLNSNLQKPTLSQPSLSTQFTPSRYIPVLITKYILKKWTDCQMEFFFNCVVLVCFQTRGNLHSFSPDRLRAQPASRGACTGAQTTTWRTCSDHSGEQRADGLIPRWCVPVAWEAQLTAQSLKYGWHAEQDEHWCPKIVNCQMKKAFIFVLSEYESVVVKFYESIYSCDFCIISACLLYMHHYRIFAQKPIWVFLVYTLIGAFVKSHKINNRKLIRT